MKFIEIIKEDKTAEQAVEELMNLMNEYCQPWLSASDEYALSVFHGPSRPLLISSFYEIRTTHKGREPKDSPERLNEIFIDFISSMDKVANRHNSKFVTGDPLFASIYGKEKLFIPIGDFNYTWTSARDLYNKAKGLSYPLVQWWAKGTTRFNNLYFMENVLNEMKGTEPYNFLINIFDNEIPSEWTNDILDNAITTRYKANVLFHFVKKNPEYIERFDQVCVEYFKEQLRNHVRVFGDDGTLQRAIRSDNEIMVSCDKYLLIDTTLKTPLSKKMGIPTEDYL